MITRLKIKGFKNLVDVDVRFGPFTCIAGPNAVGKSNLFDAIRFLSYLADKTLLDAALSIRADENKTGDIRTLFYRSGNTYAKKMSFEIELIIPSEGIDDLGRKAKATTTFVMYKLEIGYKEDSTLPSPSSLEILKEELEPIPLGEAPKIIQFRHKPTSWRKSVLKGSRRRPFISTTNEGNERRIRLHQDAGVKGSAKKLRARDMPRTVLSTAKEIESPTALIVRREMQSWMLLQLEPRSLRESDRFTIKPGLLADGSHLPATLYFLARNYNIKNQTSEENLAGIYDQVADRLSALIDDVYEIQIDEDKTRDLLTLRITDKNGTIYPARSLSDGTLRFLALTVISLDPKTNGVICMEEPENGIHPQRIPAILEILQDIACDTELEIGPDNPLRQVIVNTHSPAVVTQVPDDSLLVAELKEVISDGNLSKGVQFSFLPDTWRSKMADHDVKPVRRGKLLSYLNFVRRNESKQEKDKLLRKSQRIVDRDDFQPYLTDFDINNE
ncbi:MAG: AAA family ATPase [Spirochaetales bacterium]|nr:AAA family ATPase [Spirochaetales bacterium]